MKAQLKNGAVEILFEEGETARVVLAAVAMAAFAMYGGGQCPWPVPELPVAEAFELPRIERDRTGRERWVLLPCTVYAKAMFFTGRQIGERKVTVAFPRPLSDSMFAAFGTHLARALERVAAHQ